MHTICIDFGTSSIRAALRKQDNSPAHPLAIAPRSQIDNASIPSAIFISKAGDKLFFGDKALEAGLSRQPRLLFETSPKSWLSPANIASIPAPATSDLPFSRRQLIAGLLSLSVRDSRRAAKTALGLEPDTLVYRISHPVWISSERAQMATEYDYLRRVACAEIGGRVRDEMTADEFELWCKKASPDRRLPPPDVEVEEPVAAALELFPNPPINRRSAALVVDVGAGTIDLGLFISVLPDRASRVTRKLIAMTEPRSLFGAGDEIDNALVTLVEERLGPRGSSQIAALRNDIRRSKEQLFDTGNLVFRNVEISREELVNTEKLRQMARGLKRAIDEMFSDAGARFQTQLSASVHPIEHLDVVFAGGGANLAFLRSLVGKVVCMGKTTLSAKQAEARTPDNFEVEASRGRMAVAMGGTTFAKEWPRTEMEQPVIRSLSTPLR